MKWAGIELGWRSTDQCSRDARRCIHMPYTIPYIVIPFVFWVRVMPKFRMAEEREKQEVTATKRHFFLLLWKDMMLTISGFSVQKDANNLIKSETVANSF